MPTVSIPHIGAQAPASTRARYRRSEDIYAGIAITLLISMSLISLLHFGALYADGANYMLQLLTTKDFVHISDNRIFATYLTQTPIVIALNSYALSIHDAIMIYSASLFAVPVCAYGYALWLTRNNPVAFVLTVAVVTLSYLTTIFIIIGEFQVLYSLAWLYAVLITVNEHNNFLHRLLLLFAAVIMIRSYEASLVIAPALAIMTVFASRQASHSIEKFFHFILIVLLVISAATGLYGYLWPRDAINSDGFVRALLRIVDDKELLILSLCLIASASIACMKNPYLRAAAIGVVAFFTSLLLWRGGVSGYIDILSLGSPNVQRAQTLPFYLVCLGLLFLNQLYDLQRWMPRKAVNYAPLLMPLVIAGAFHLVNVHRWHAFIQLTCSELEAPTGEAYYSNPTVRTFGWHWEMPTLSVLLRPEESSTMLFFPNYNGWLPFDHEKEVPNIDAYKRAGGLCPIK